MGRTRIKICGVRDEEGASAAAEAGADAVGFVFVASSPRFIDPVEAYELMTLLPPLVSTVGVFADASIDDFSDAEEVCPTMFSQLHGREDAKLVKACGPDVIKGIRFEAGTIAMELQQWEESEDVCAILIDGTAPGSGGAFDWALLTPHLAEVRKPIFLAGGLTPPNVGAAIRAVRPYAVDVSSGVERAPGVKDAGLIEAFCRAVREADGDGGRH